jgi:hypothetical protein
MAKNRNTTAKRDREMEKKRKAEEKRQRRRQRKEPADDPATPEFVQIPAAAADTPHPE